MISNFTVVSVHAIVSEEDAGYGILGGLVIGAAITYFILNNNHEKIVREKEEQHQKAINKCNEDIKVLNELLKKNNEKTPQEIFG